MYSVSSLFSRSYSGRITVPPMVAFAAYGALIAAFITVQAMGPRLSFLQFFLLYEGVILLGMPVVVVLLMRVGLRRGLRLQAPKSYTWMIAYTIATVPFLFFYFSGVLWLAGVSEATRDTVIHEVRWIYTSLRHSPAFALLGAGVLVAVAEEAFFRGMLLGSIEWRVRTFTACVIVGLLFGIMHLELGKLIPTAVAGMWFTYVSLRTRTVFTGMIVHFILNTSVFLFLANSALARRWAQQGAPPQVAGWFLASAAVLGGVIVACELLHRRKQDA